MAQHDDRDRLSRRGEGWGRGEQEDRESGAPRTAGRGRDRGSIDDARERGFMSEGRGFGSSRGGYGGEYDQGGDDRGRRDEYGEDFGNDYGMQGGFGQAGRQSYRGPEFGRGGDREGGGRPGGAQRGYGSDEASDRVPYGAIQSGGRQQFGGDSGTGGPYGTSAGNPGGLERTRQASGAAAQGNYGGAGGGAAGGFRPGFEDAYRSGGTYGRTRPGGPDLDRGQPGPHRGKGPKGYQRTDERIREDVCERLAMHGDIDASEVEIQVSGGVATLTGSVEDRQMKRLAEEVVESVRGVKDVHNQLRVAQGGQSESWGRQGAPQSMNTPQNTIGTQGVPGGAAAKQPDGDPGGMTVTGTNAGDASGAEGAKPRGGQRKP